MALLYGAVRIEHLPCAGRPEHPCPLGMHQPPGTAIIGSTMDRKLLLLIGSVAISAAACGGASSNNTNANTRNSNVAIVNVNAPVEANVPPANIPPDLSGDETNSSSRSSTGNKAVPLGTPAKASAAGEKNSKGNAAANSGIPSAEEMRRMMSGQPKMDANKPATMQGPPMMKSNRPLGGRMSGNSNQ